MSFTKYLNPFTATELWLADSEFSTFAKVLLLSLFGPAILGYVIGLYILMPVGALWWAALIGHDIMPRKKE